MAWFSFTGSDPANPNDYTLAGSSAPNCGTKQEQLCAIQATNDGNDHPELDVTILSEMVQALNAPANTPNVKLKAR